MKKRFRFLRALFLLFCSFAAVTLQAQDEIAGFQTQLTKIYDLYKTDQTGSCQQLEKALQSPEVSSLTPAEAKSAFYFMANCTYQKKNLDQAADYYLKVAEMAPQDPQPLLDAGSVYIEQGRYDQAEKKYKEALELAAGNRSEEARIRSMIKYNPGNLQKNFSVTTGIGYDSNVNSGPQDNVHSLYGTFNYTLDPDEKQKDDLFHYNRAAGAFHKALDPATYLLFNAAAQYTGYFSEHDFNTAHLSTSVGYQKIFGNKSITLLPFVNYQTLDDSGYQINSGVNLSGAIKVSEKINFWPLLGWYVQNFYKEDLRDSQGVSTGASASYQFNPKTSLIGSLFYTHNAAETSQYTYNNIFLGSSINRTLSENWKAALGYNLALFYYQGVDPAFGSERKDDGHTVYINLDYSLKKMLNLDNAFLTLSVSYNKNNSNHSFQDTDRVFSSSKITFWF